jgi:predicted nucleic acid-binding protein
MYVEGAPHPHTSDAQRVLARLLSERVRLVTDAEVLREILHRCVATDRRDVNQSPIEASLGVVGQVLAVDLAAAERAKTIVLAAHSFSARAALHLAVMEQQSVDRIIGLDAG